jgi:hypothetical protein
MKQSSYKNCSSGHFYPASLDKCPFCKSEVNENKSAGSGNENGDKTLMMGNQNLDNADKTVIEGTENKTVAYGSGNVETNSDKTMIVSTGTNNEKKEVVNFSRKLVGWLVSFTINENGVDFRLYEGQNVIGRDVKSDIRVVEDPSLSAKHATILFRNGGMYLRDEMSTNPSFVNGEEVMPGNTVKVNDGDNIQVGKTIFTLRFAIV